MRVLMVLIAATLFLLGCGQDPASESAAVPTAADVADAPPATATSLPAPTATPLPVPTERAASPTATAAATEFVATAEPPPSPTPEPAATQRPFFGQTDEGAFYRGAWDAPVTLVDYSDFL